jgi:hypothetical protein
MTSVRSGGRPALQAAEITPNPILLRFTFVYNLGHLPFAQKLTRMNGKDMILAQLWHSDT